MENIRNTEKDFHLQPELIKQAR